MVRKGGGLVAWRALLCPSQECACGIRIILYNGSYLQDWALNNSKFSSEMEWKVLLFLFLFFFVWLIFLSSFTKTNKQNKKQCWPDSKVVGQTDSSVLASRFCGMVQWQADCITTGFSFLALFSSWYPFRLPNEVPPGWKQYSPRFQPTVKFRSYESDTWVYKFKISLLKNTFFRRQHYFEMFPRWYFQNILKDLVMGCISEFFIIFRHREMKH